MTTKTLIHLYIVHQGRPGHVQRMELAAGEDAARKLCSQWRADGFRQGQSRGLVGYTRARLRDLGTPSAHWQAGKYSLVYRSAYAVIGLPVGRQ